MIGWKETTQEVNTRRGWSENAANWGSLNPTLRHLEFRVRHLPVSTFDVSEINFHAYPARPGRTHHIERLPVMLARQEFRASESLRADTKTTECFSPI